MKQTVRIIGGQYRGKKISFPVADGLRPTPDRVKETLFNWLMNDIREAKCLDAFAGSGSLGFEAFSRGAGRVVLLEAAPGVYKNLKQIAQDFNSPKLQVINTKAQDYFQKTQEQFNLIFLDPPFAENYLPECMNQLASSTLLAPGGLVYLETAQPIEVDSTQWEKRKSKKAGQVIYELYQKISP